MPKANKGKEQLNEELAKEESARAAEAEAHQTENAKLQAE